METLAAMHELAWALHRQGRHAEARAQWEKMLELQRRVKGDGPPDPLAELVTGLVSRGKWVEAQSLAQEWLAVVEAPQGKRMEVFEGSGHAPFLTETDRFVETVRGFAAGIAVRPE